MSQLQTFKVLGLSSGSELEGLNAAVITTDGVDVFDFGPTFELPFDEDMRDDLRKLHQNFTILSDVEKDRVADKFTSVCMAFAKEILSQDDSINLIGFGGHIICHKPSEHILYQIGDNARMAKECSIDVVGNFRNADILAGGQGAPLSAIYHAAISQNIAKPLAWIDIGGISALTIIGPNGEMQAYDAGAGNAVINDWVNKHANMHMDFNGKLAISGHIHDDILSSLLRHKFLRLAPPKAADKSTFCDKCEHLEGLSLEDGAATATAFVAQSILNSINDFAIIRPEKLIICGGGAKNPTLMRFIKQRSSDIEVLSADECGFSASYIEAQAFGFLAARRLNQMPTSYPFTTGAAFEVIGGEFFGK